MLMMITEICEGHFSIECKIVQNLDMNLNSLILDILKTANTNPIMKTTHLLFCLSFSVLLAVCNCICAPNTLPVAVTVSNHRVLLHCKLLPCVGPLPQTQCHQTQSNCQQSNSFVSDIQRSASANGRLSMTCCELGHGRNRKYERSQYIQWGRRVASTEPADDRWSFIGNVQPIRTGVRIDWYSVACAVTVVRYDQPWGDLFKTQPSRQRSLGPSRMLSASQFTLPTPVTQKISLDPSWKSLFDQRQPEREFIEPTIDAYEGVLQRFYNHLKVQEKENKEKQKNTRAPALCFSGNGTVKTPQGPKEMKHLRINDQVACGQDDRHPIEYCRVLYWLHRQSDQSAVFIHIQTVNDRTVSLTPLHLIYNSADCSKKTFKPIFAKNVMPGSCVYELVDDNQFEVAKVRKVYTSILDDGVFAPYTSNGRIMVNQILASCHSGVENEVLANTVVKWIMPFTDWLINRGTVTGDGEVPLNWLTHSLYDMASVLLGDPLMHVISF